MDGTTIDEGTRDILIGTGRTAHVFQQGSGRVLKLFKPGYEAEAIANEFAASKLAWSLDLPVAEPFSIGQWKGRTGIQFERLTGESIETRYAHDPAGMLLALRRLAMTQATIHACPASGLPRQREVLRGLIAASRASDLGRQAALAALENLPDADRLCHGDLHTGNAICTPAGLRIIDWHLATVGHPAADVARTASMIRFGGFNPGKARGWRHLDLLRVFATSWYVRTYAAVSGMPVSAIKAWWLPTLAARLAGRVGPSEARLHRAVDGLARKRRPDRRTGDTRPDAMPPDRD